MGRRPACQPAGTARILDRLAVIFDTAAVLSLASWHGVDKSDLNISCIMNITD